MKDFIARMLVERYGNIAVQEKTLTSLEDVKHYIDVHTLGLAKALVRIRAGAPSMYQPTLDAMCHTTFEIHDEDGCFLSWGFSPTGNMVKKVGGN